MSVHQYPLEQDSAPAASGGDLPTYDDLAAQNGPNSRFGRWRGWIEKRAAERYIDVGPDERRRRRDRGWGDETINVRNANSVPIIVNEPATPMPQLNMNSLQIQTDGLADYYAQPPDTPLDSSPLPSLTSITHRLRPSHLKITNFGSRFLPHSTSPIRCVLPLLGGKLILIGHDEGLSVLDTYPQEWSETEAGIKISGPDDAVSRPIWHGESVFQMSLLEVEESGEGSPQGVVLALVGPELDSPLGKDDTLRTLRMYNLASLTSLAKWAVAQKGTRPLDLSSRPSNQHHQSPPVKKKGHRPQGSIARSIKSWMDQPSSNQLSSHSSYNQLLSPASSMSGNTLGRPTSNPRSRSPSPNRQDSDDSNTSWDLIDDLPSRWALDFVPLASPGSRLSTSNVLSYALWNNGDPHQPRSGRLLAVATKSNILLYETPKGERAFRFIKEFYTPMQPRSITFFQQVVVDVTRSPSDVGSNRLSHSHHRRSDSAGTTRGERIVSSSMGSLGYGTQLSLFVVFDKKAGWIRLADSAVGEFELFDDGYSSGGHMREASSPVSIRKSRISFDASGLLGKWIPLTQCEVPILPSAIYPPPTKKVHILTRGRRTHILPSPLPTGSCRPIRAIMWKAAPTSVAVRVCTNEIGDGPSPYLQIVGYGDYGVEVQELSLSFMIMGKGKGKERGGEDVWAEDDAGGPTGFLCLGGHWDQPHYSPYHPLNRTHSTASDMSGTSFDSLESNELRTKMEQEQGMYAWCRKGLEDWRVFWLGGSTTEEDDDDDDEEN